MKNTIPELVIGLIAVIGVSLATDGPAAAQEAETSVYENMDLFIDVFNRIQKDYVEELSEKELIERAVSGMLSSLDPHSGYMTADDMMESTEQTKGEFGGLGIEVTLENGFVKVVSPIDDTPAFEAGLQAGDFITMVDGKSIFGLTLGDAVDLLRGPVGSDVTITISREGVDGTFEVTITRAIIEISSASVRLEGDAIVVRIKTFNEQTMPNIIEGIEEAAADVGGLDNILGMALDLRNNPGGLLTTAVEVSDAFLHKGEIVSIRGRDSSQNNRYVAQRGDLVKGKPIVVLINSGSASASEIVAAALQDNERAILVGTKSFGKGSVQTLANLGPKRGGIRLTTARYYRPSGISIQAEGVEPDIILQQRPQEEEAEEEPVSEANFPTEADLVNRLENDSPIDEEEKDELAEEERVAAIEKLRKTDFQLAYSLDLLAGLAVLGSK